MSLPFLAFHHCPLCTDGSLGSLSPSPLLGRFREGAGEGAGDGWLTAGSGANVATAGFFLRISYSSDSKYKRGKRAW